MDYLNGGDIADHERPRWVLTSDFKMLQVTDLYKSARAVGRTRTIYVSDLPEHVDDFLWLTGSDVDDLLETEQVEASVSAARLMASLFTSLAGDEDTGGENLVGAEDINQEDQRVSQISILLTRLLFLMFADDASIDRWPRDAFQKFVEQRTYGDGSNLGAQLHALFDTLNKPEAARSRRLDEALARIPYVNGDLFSARIELESFTAPMRQALIAACKFDWSRISPAVFGSLFQTIKSREARHADGEHYTSEVNILKTLGPLFLDDLKRRIDGATSAPQLVAIHEDMSRMRFIDPACGCGNFLVVAYREMRALELRLLVRLRERRGESGEQVLDASSLLNVQLSQFSGVELNWWPAKIAETAMFLVDHQANRQMVRTLGGAPDRLPINISANIYHANALELDWSETFDPREGQRVFMFGNPPFVGYDDRTDAQRAELQSVWNRQDVGRLDYVTAWFGKAKDYFERISGEFAFVSTNSISQGEPVPLLFKPLFSSGWRVKFAHRTFEWVTEAPSKERAFVHCVIVGMTKDHSAKQRLFYYERPRSAPEERSVRTDINAYLLDAPNVVVEKHSSPMSADLKPLKNGCVAGDTSRDKRRPDLVGLPGLVLTSEERAAIIASKDPASNYLRQFTGGADFLNDGVRYCLWMPDGPDPEDLRRSSELRTRLQNVAKVRLASSEPSTRELAEAPYRFKHLAQPTTRYICMPRTVSVRRSYFVLGYLKPTTIVSNGSFWAEDKDGLVFSVASSAMFMAWQRAVGGRIKSDPRFANTLVWNTFPLPQISTSEKNQLADAGKVILNARASHRGRTLAQQYDPLSMAPDLLAAHRALDARVDKIFGLKRGQVSEEKRQITLFGAYAELT